MQRLYLDLANEAGFANDAKYGGTITASVTGSPNFNVNGWNIFSQGQYAQIEGNGQPFLLADPQTAYSISFWIESAASENTRAVFSVGSENTFNWFSFYREAGSLVGKIQLRYKRLDATNITVVAETETTSDIFDGTRRHISIAYDPINDFIRVWVDKSLEIAKPLDAPAEAIRTSQPFRYFTVGGRTNSSGTDLLIDDLTLDKLRCFTHALTQAEVDSLVDEVDYVETGKAFIGIGNSKKQDEILPPKPTLYIDDSDPPVAAQPAPYFLHELVKQQNWGEHIGAEVIGHIDTGDSINVILNRPLPGAAEGSPPVEAGAMPYGWHGDFLGNVDVDGLLFNPHDSDGATLLEDQQAISTFVTAHDSGIGHTNTLIYVSETTPSFLDSDGGKSADWRAEWRQPVVDDDATPTVCAKEYYDHLVARLEVTFPGRVRRIKFGQVLDAFYDRVDELDGITSVMDMIRDEDTIYHHLGFGFARRVAAHTMAATVYQRPVSYFTTFVERFGDDLAPTTGQLTDNNKAIAIEIINEVEFGASTDALRSHQQLLVPVGY